MADYIYLLENRLSSPQRNALRIAREVARSRGLTIFLVGGAVRDLTSGSPVRDLDVVVQGNALKSRKDLEKAGAVIVGENEAAQALYLRLPGHVRMEFGSTLSVAFPKPGKPVLKPASILEDLRRRDFTVNAMALSLNEGSYGLLMDPLNGTADIENRHLRLVSNYGFIEDPVRMIRAARLMARLGWMMDERTQQRYETGKQEGYISAMSDFHRGYELEEIVHEEDPLRVMRGLEAEGWMKQLSPFWSSAKANTAELERLRDAQTQLELQNIHPDNGAANFPLLTAKLSAQETASLKASFPRPGFVEEIEALEGTAKQFAAQLAAKTAALPSQAWRLITTAPPEAVLWVTYANKNASIQARLKAFSTEWPQARQKMPYAQMQEMRITPDLPGYEDLLEKLFFELMDGKLGTPEEMKAFLEPYSPPAPPPQINLRKARAPKKEPKARASKAKSKPEEEVLDGTRTAVDENTSPEDGAAQTELIAAKPATPTKSRPKPASKAAVTAPEPAVVSPMENLEAKAEPVVVVKPTKLKPESAKFTAPSAATPAKPAVKTGASASPAPATRKTAARPANAPAKAPLKGVAKVKTAKPPAKGSRHGTAPQKSAAAKRPSGKKASKPQAAKKTAAQKTTGKSNTHKPVAAVRRSGGKPVSKSVAAGNPRKKSSQPKPAAPRSRQAGKTSTAASRKSGSAGKKSATASRKSSAKSASAKAAKSKKPAKKSARR